MISLVCCTYRPGGIDLLVGSLINTRGEGWELVLVDDCPGRAERGEAEKYIRDHKIPLGWYGPSKPQTVVAKGGLCNAMNTALLHARGDYTVWVSDYTLLPAHWLLQWQHHGKVNPPETLLSGVAIEYAVERPKAPGDVRTWEGSIPPPTPVKPWVPLVFETFYYGAPTRWFELVNGNDERADHCMQWQVEALIAQAKILGWSLKVCQETVCHMIDHRRWQEEENGTPEGFVSEGTWRKIHTSSLDHEPEWVVPSPNPFCLAVERAKTRRERDG